MIGLGFFLPLDLSFTCWFFYVLRRLISVLVTYLGLTHLPGFPYFHEQAGGGWFCLFFIAIWATRKHLVFAFRTAFSATSSADADEPMRYRTALIGLAGGFLFMAIFSAQAGMSLVAIPIFFALYFAIALVITRLRAEFGAPHRISNNPMDVMVTCFGSLAWGGRNLTVMSFYQWFNRSYRSHANPNQFEPLKMAEVANINSRRLVWAMMLGSAIALIVGMWTNLDLMYRDGATARVSFFKIWGRQYSIPTVGNLAVSSDARRLAAYDVYGRWDGANLDSVRLANAFLLVAPSPRWLSTRPQFLDRLLLVHLFYQLGVKSGYPEVRQS